MVSENKTITTTIISPINPTCHVKFPKIMQFRHVVKELSKKGYKSEKPTFPFQGTVKLHGSNMGIGFCNDNMWFQNRNTLIGEDNDYMKFMASFSTPMAKSWLQETNKRLRAKYDIDDALTLVLYGEWCGENIQKRVALEHLSKRFVLFAIRVVGAHISKDRYADERWLPINEISNHEIRFYNIQQDAETFELEIDFYNPDKAALKMEELVQDVENECPFAKTFGVSGRGEGIVWTGRDGYGRTYRFKTVGSDFRKAVQQNAAPVSVAKFATTEAFVEYACTNARLEQGIEQVYTKHGDRPSRKDLHFFSNWVANDIISEEAETMIANGIKTKTARGKICHKAVEWLLQIIGDENGTS